MAFNQNGRIIEFKYHLHKKSGGAPIRLRNVVSCKVSQVSLGRLKTSASLVMREDDRVDFLNDQIQISCTITNPDGTVTDTDIARLYLSSPRRVHNFVTNPERPVQCYSLLLALDQDKLLERYVIPGGTNLVNEAKRLIKLVTGVENFDIPSSDKTNRTVMEFAIGTPYLDVINTMLDSINYTSLHTSPTGLYISKPYVLPELREPEITYDFTAQEKNIYRDLVEDIDGFDIPNYFIRVSSSLEQETLVASYENNRMDSPTSTANRRRNVSFESVGDVSDLQTLQDICKRDAVELTSKYNHLEFSTSINPKHGYMNCIQIRIEDVQGKYIETSWEMDCRPGGQMKHTMRKAVLI